MINKFILTQTNSSEIYSIIRAQPKAHVLNFFYKKKVISNLQIQKKKIISQKENSCIKIALSMFISPGQPLYTEIYCGFYKGKYLLHVTHSADCPLGFTQISDKNILCNCEILERDTAIKKLEQLGFNNPIAWLNVLSTA